VTVTSGTVVVDAAGSRVLGTFSTEISPEGGLG